MILEVTRDSHHAKMQDLMKANGLEIDDRTIIDKLKAFDKSTMFSEGKDLVSGIKTVVSFVSKVAKLAA